MTSKNIVMKRLQLFQLVVVAVCLCNTAIAGAWIKKADIPGFEPGRWGAMSFTLNNKIYVGGGYLGSVSLTQWWGNDLNMYDPATNTWTTKNKLPGTVTSRTAGVAFVINGKAYLGLGADSFLSFTGGQKNLSDLWEYNPSGDSWTKKADFPETGVTDAAVFVADGKAYVVGGSTSSSGSGSYSSKTWEYNPTTNKWTEKASYPDGVISGAFGFGLNNKGYVAGGRTASAYTLKTYEYTPSANSWAPKKDYPDTARSGGITFVAGGLAYCGLGGGGGTFPKGIWGYNPTSDTWRYLQGSPFPWAGAAFGVTGVVNNKVYIGGGWRMDGSTQSFYKYLYELDYSAILGVATNNETSKKLNVFPNPSNGKVYVDLPNQSKEYSYNVFALTGQKVASGNVGTDHSVTISHLTSGQYVLEIAAEKETLRCVITLCE
jgi:N-acetylneuraminic acid mutarotase